MFVAVGAYEPQRVCSTVCSHLDPNDCHLVLHGFTVYIVFPICGFCCVVLLFFTLFTLPPGYLGTLRSAQVLIIGGDLLGPSYVTFDPWGPSAGEVSVWPETLSRDEVVGFSTGSARDFIRFTPRGGRLLKQRATQRIGSIGGHCLPRPSH